VVPQQAGPATPSGTCVGQLPLWPKQHDQLRSCRNVSGTIVINFRELLSSAVLSHAHALYNPASTLATCLPGSRRDPVQQAPRQPALLSALFSVLQHTFSLFPGLLRTQVTPPGIKLLCPASLHNTHSRLFCYSAAFNSVLRRWQKAISSGCLVGQEHLFCC
jgi:hypothetical protein